MSLCTKYPAGTGSMPIPTSPKKTLKCRARSSDFERKLGSKFVLNPNILYTVVAASSPDSLLLQLPYEVLLVVFSSLDNAPSQVALALTCKKLAIIARDVPLSLSPTSRKYAGFLPVSVFDVPDLLHSLRPTMPSHLRLCNHCLTYRPSAQSYYATVAGCEVSNFWIQKTGWVFNGGWQKQVHDICPACHVSCTFSDYVDCDGCIALGRLGDVDWSRVGDHWRRRGVEEVIRGGVFAT